ncbi:MAG: hypothetical protein ACLFV7_14845 [Phycisphaerae bacterium]
MTMPKTLTKSAEKRITEDWHGEIPSMGIYQPRWLLRRVGPILEGICLDRDSGGDAYKPIFHVHLLAREFPCVSLTLGTQLRSERSGGPDFVQVRWHAEKYEDAAKRMIRQSLLPLEGDLSLGELIQAYRDHLVTPMGRLQPVLLYFDIIILLAWARDSASARDVLAECMKIKSGPRNVAINRIEGGKVVQKRTHMLQDPEFGHVGGRENFEATCQRVIENPAEIQQTVDSQISALGVDHLPVSKLIV